LLRYLKIIQPISWRVFLAIFISPILFSGCIKEQSTWDQIQESGVLRIGLDPTFPPFEVADEQNVWGLDVDLANAIAVELGLRSEFTYFGYDGLYDALSTKQVDVLISALVIVPERMGDFAYSDSYFNAGQVLVTGKDQMISETPDLEGRTIAVELGAQGHLLATTWQRSIPDLNIQVKDSSEEALSSISNGDVDAVVVDHVSARLHREQTPNLQIHMLDEASEPYALVVRVEDQKLLDELNQTLDKMKRNGQLESIINSWLDPK
jgi:polar amino acid transport system substrate-binding protein